MLGAEGSAARGEGTGGQGWGSSSKYVVRVGHDVPREANNVWGKGKAAVPGSWPRAEGGWWSAVPREGPVLDRSMESRDFFFLSMCLP